MQATDIIRMIDDFEADSSVPKNVRLAVDEAKRKLRDNTLDLSLRVSDAIYKIEKVTEDPNLMAHARMGLWNILSALESIKKK